MKINTREALARIEKEELPSLMQEITAACRKGYFEVTIVKGIRFDSTIDKLIQLGYKVERGEYGRYYVISWE